ncbi:MAG: class II fructose-bisphosphate aldolase [Spirochaetia bacterium]
MKIEGLRAVLQRAVKEKFALPAFNTLNMEFTSLIVEVAEETKSPIILQITESSVKYAGFDYIDAILGVADRSEYVFVHLDHGTSLENIKRCLASNAFTSVMIDRSKESFQNNLAATQEVVAMSCGKLIEAELGIVGGKEEEIEAEETLYTDKVEAIEFIEKTQIALFAPAVGTLHGIYKNTPKLNYELIKDLRSASTIPLVLHGSSGLSDDEVRTCVEAGMNKINIDTELKQHFIMGFMDFMKKDPSAYDLRKIFGAAKDEMRKILLHKINICGAMGQLK